MKKIITVLLNVRLRLLGEFGFIGVQPAMIRAIANNHSMKKQGL